MRDQTKLGFRPWETQISERDLGFEVIDMLAQANIDFRRLSAEELRNLSASAQPETDFLGRRPLAGALS